MLEHLVDTTTLGVTKNNSLSTYQIGGTINLNALSVLNIDINANGYVALNGAQVSMYFKAKYNTLRIPLVDYGNMPSGYTSGERVVEIFYYTSGSIDDEQIFMKRTSTYKKLIGRNTTIEDSALITGTQFKDDLLGWLMLYVLGLTDKTYSKIEDAVSKETTSVAAPHFEDVIHGFTFNNNYNEPEWKISLDLGELLHKSILNDINATIKGTSVTIDNKEYRSLSSLNADFTLGSLITILSASVSATLDNVSGGVYRDVWTNSTIQNFFLNNFINSQEQIVGQAANAPRPTSASNLY